MMTAAPGRAERRVGVTAGLRRDLVVIGGSAGALDPLRAIVRHLPADLPAAVVVVFHLAATSPSSMAAILNRAGTLHAVTPRDGDVVRPGDIYVPVPDHHTVLRDGTVHLTRGPKVNGLRPAVDALFASAAEAYGARVVGVVLSGALDDGSAGLAAIRAAGGLGIVQAPHDALIDSMPRRAISLARPDHVLLAERIGEAIVRAVGEGADGGNAEKQAGGTGAEALGAGDSPGVVTRLPCPECHGSAPENAEALRKLTMKGTRA